MRRAGLQLIEDRVADVLGIAAQMRIPKTQRLDAARLQKLFALRVVFPLVGKTMLAAVQFHIQFRLLAKEIQIVNAERMLAAKFVAAEAPTAQPAPDKFFRPGFILAKLAGAFDVGHDGNLGNVDEMGKLVLTLALTLTLSPKEREQPVRVSVFPADRPANPVAGFSKARRMFLLLLGGEGRDEGGRETNFEICV